MIKRFVHFETTVISFDETTDRYYFKDENGEDASMEAHRIHKYVILPSYLLDEEGHIIQGSSIYLVHFSNGMFAPDKIKYPSIDDDRASRNSTKHRGIPREVLFENVPVEKLVYSIEELTSKYYSIIKDVPIDKQLIIAQAMHSGNEDSIRSLLERELNIIHIYSQEDAHTEYKSSLFKHPDPRKGDKEQMRELLQEIVAFANAHIEGHLFIGLNNNGSPTGLEKELCSDACPFETREKLQSDFCNRLQQATNSKLLMNNLKFYWSQTEDHHLYLRIDVPVWNGDIVLLYGNELYLRKETGVFMLEDSDMIAYIRQTA